MTDTKTITAGLALLGAVGLAAQAQAAAPPNKQEVDQHAAQVGDTAEATLEEVILASGLHQQSGNGVDVLLLGDFYERDLIQQPTAATIEEVVLASGLHQQATAMTAVFPVLFNQLTLEHGLQPDPVDISFSNPKAAKLEEILLASGLHQQHVVGLYNVNPATLEEVVLASGLHQQGTVFVYDDITTPAIEEIVLASGLHQQGVTTIIRDDPGTFKLEYVVMTQDRTP
jgi:putative ubiquitin-RnfH superfamily antitoxin RatB of RatAB toxin-antitoxin module